MGAPLGLVLFGLAVAAAGPDGRLAELDGDEVVVETAAGPQRLGVDAARPKVGWSPEGRWLCAGDAAGPGGRSWAAVSALGETRRWQASASAEVWTLVVTDRGECALGLSDGRVLLGTADGAVERFRSRGWPRAGVVSLAVGDREILMTDARRTTRSYPR